eukprot:TRINITY_DN914_c4_g1_i1.p1 TRINITY_DN914_c4_g1~~TRINITY_DN914_c4_g1_i1.p1  ORF type:complete len:485 (+),score=99.99 TRINITY_DN914_c4_g1_i1:98-1456(+)
MEEHNQRARDISNVVSAAIREGLLPDHTDAAPSADLYNLDALDARLEELKSAFGESFFEHCIAVKANPTSGVLARVVSAGLGLECASVGEVVHSIQLGAKNVIFDSPCKSKADLMATLLDTKNVYVNLDNEDEVATINEIIKENPNWDYNGRIGLRINPVVGAGKIASVSTAARGSKFGLPLVAETRERLLNLYKNNKWLQGVHIHVGSQGCEMNMLVTGCKTIFAFVKELESLGCTIRVIDIGGGVPTSYTTKQEAHQFQTYRNALNGAVPGLFTGKYRIMTEFGRCVLTKPGITLSRIAAVKGAPYHVETPLLVAHVGSNQFVREAYLGDVWRHRFTILSPSGSPQPDSGVVTYDICGPLCFQGDYIGRKHQLPGKVSVNDVLVMHDTGGYTLAMYSKYNSRQAGPVYGYRQDSNGKFSFVTLKTRETISETTAFWGPERPRPVGKLSKL